MSDRDDTVRRSAAAQFFAEEQEAAEKTSTYDRVVELINQATLMSKDSLKIANLKQVQELIIHKDGNLLDNFFDEMIAFQSDRSTDVRKFVVGFMEDACKKDPDLLTKIMPCLQHLLNDENVNVVKKVILTLSSIYRTLLSWLTKSKFPAPEMTQVWDIMARMKKQLYDMLDSENDGIRTHAVKFTEGIVLTLSHKTKESEVPKTTKGDKDISLDTIPENSKYLKVNKLEEEGKKMFDALLQFQASPHISSINLMTVMGSLTNIAKQRPSFFGRVVQAFETLHVNLPPTLAKSQVSSVRKNLKMQMLALLKHSCGPDYMTNITTLLTDLGATQSEVLKAMPKLEEMRKRKRDEAGGSSSKKIKINKEDLQDDDDDDIGLTPWTDRATDKKLASVKLRQTAIDITAEDLVPRLSPSNVADLVLISMVMLPDTMPAHFQATYTPIAAAGTDGQIGHMARLLATQLTMAGMGKGIAEVQREQAENKDSTAGGESPAFQGTSPKQLISTVVGGQSGTTKMDLLNKAMLPPPPQFPTRRGVKSFKLATVTQPLEPADIEELSIMSIDRILQSDKPARMGNAGAARTKMLSCIVTLFGGDFKDILQNYIFTDLRNRTDLVFAWLYQEYAKCMNFNSVALDGRQNMTSYDECLTRLLNGIMEFKDHFRESLFHKILLEAPVITDNALFILRGFCMDEERCQAGLKTLKTLIMSRPNHRLRFLDVLLEFTSSDKEKLREQAITFTKELYETRQVHHAIEYYAVQMLKYLLLPKPSPELYAKLRGRQEAPETWEDDAIKMSLYLYLGLLPCNHKLIHELATVYTSTDINDIKRTILRMIEPPITAMGKDSPEILSFVENCPKGAETLITRIIHLLTDKVTPSPELVARVRELFHKRVSDIRFIVPVLPGLTKKEILDVLPRLMKTNTVVMKEVFTKLLGGHGTYQSPLTPAELLIALHNLDEKVVDMKTTIKATSFIYSAKKVYTQEVLALVMQQLMEQTPLPKLFMRTVIQSLSMYPRLIGLVLNILQRLILKEVWTQKKVWEGFVKCCQRTKPQSFQVLLQLPPEQLKDVFMICPDLRLPLLGHINSLTDVQRSHIPQAIMIVVETDHTIEKREQEIREERMRQEAEQMMMLRQEAEMKAAQNSREPEPDRRRERSVERAKENRAPVNEPESRDTSIIYVKQEPGDDPSEPPRERPRERPSTDTRERRADRMAGMNPEPSETVTTATQRRRTNDSRGRRNPSPQLRNPSPSSMDVDLGRVKTEKEDKR